MHITQFHDDICNRYYTIMFYARIFKIAVQAFLVCQNDKWEG